MNCSVSARASRHPIHQAEALHFTHIHGSPDRHSTNKEIKKLVRFSPAIVPTLPALIAAWLDRQSPQKTDIYLSIPFNELQNQIVKSKSAHL